MAKYKRDALDRLVTKKLRRQLKLAKKIEMTKALYKKREAR